MRPWLTNITTSPKYPTIEDVERALAAESLGIAERNSESVRTLEVRINGLLVPPTLVQLVVSGRWRIPSDPAKLQERFPKGLSFYSFEYLLFENSHWSRNTEPTWVGIPDVDSPPGDIDLRQSLVIADLGLGAEQPIALDYRESASAPSVLLLEYTPDSHWTRIAPTIEAFAEQIGIQ